MEYLSAAHELGIVTIMNPSPLPTADQTREFPWAKLSWLIVNEGEARDLLTSVGEPHSMDTIGLVIPPGVAPEHRTVVLSAHANGSKLSSHPTFKGVNIICTLGSVGLIAFMSLVQEVGRQAVYLHTAKFNGPVVDTTGAGDCFTGYFVSGLMDIGPGHKADLVGVLSASIKVRPFIVTPQPVLGSNV
jgi:ribokinase